MLRGSKSPLKIKENESGPEEKEETSLSKDQKSFKATKSKAIRASKKENFSDGTKARPQKRVLRCPKGPEEDLCPPAGDGVSWELPGSCFGVLGGAVLREPPLPLDTEQEFPSGGAVPEGNDFYSTPERDKAEGKSDFDFTPERDKAEGKSDFGFYSAPEKHKVEGKSDFDFYSAPEKDKAEGKSDFDIYSAPEKDKVEGKSDFGFYSAPERDKAEGKSDFDSYSAPERDKAERKSDFDFTPERDKAEGKSDFDSTPERDRAEGKSDFDFYSTPEKDKAEGKSDFGFYSAPEKHKVEGKSDFDFYSAPEKDKAEGKSDFGFYSAPEKHKAEGKSDFGFYSAPERDKAEGKSDFDFYSAPEKHKVEGKSDFDFYSAPERDKAEGKSDFDFTPERDKVEGKSDFDSTPERDKAEGKSDFDFTPERDKAEGKSDFGLPGQRIKAADFAAVTIAEFGNAPEGFPKRPTGTSPNSLKFRRRSTIGLRGSPENNTLIRYLAQQRSSRQKETFTQICPFNHANVRSLKHKIDAFQISFESLREAEAEPGLSHLQRASSQNKTPFKKEPNLEWWSEKFLLGSRALKENLSENETKRSRRDSRSCRILSPHRAGTVPGPAAAKEWVREQPNPVKSLETAVAGDFLETEHASQCHMCPCSEVPRCEHSPGGDGGSDLSPRRDRGDTGLDLSPRRIGGDTGSDLSPRNIRGDSDSVLSPRKVTGDTGSVLSPRNIRGDTGSDLSPRRNRGDSGSDLSPRKVTGDTWSDLTPRNIRGDTGLELSPRKDRGDTGSALSPRKVTGDTGSALSPRRNRGDSDSGLSPRKDQGDTGSGLSPRNITGDTGSALSPRRVRGDTGSALSPRRVRGDTGSALSPRRVRGDTGSALSPTRVGFVADAILGTLHGSHALVTPPRAGDAPSCDLSRSGSLLRSILKKTPARELLLSPTLSSELALQEYSSNAIDRGGGGEPAAVSSCVKTFETLQTDTAETQSSKTPKTKKVTFGEVLSPEIFDQALPANTPLRRGASPGCPRGHSLSAEPLPLLDWAWDEEHAEPVQEFLENPVAAESPPPFEKAEVTEAATAAMVTTRSSSKRKQGRALAQDTDGDTQSDRETKNPKKNKVQRQKNPSTAAPKKTQKTKYPSYGKRRKKKAKKSLYGEREIASKKPLLSPIPEIPEVFSSVSTPDSPKADALFSEGDPNPRNVCQNIPQEEEEDGRSRGKRLWAAPGDTEWSSGTGETSGALHSAPEFSNIAPAAEGDFDPSEYFQQGEETPREKEAKESNSLIEKEEFQGNLPTGLGIVDQQDGPEPPPEHSARGDPAWRRRRRRSSAFCFPPAESLEVTGMDLAVSSYSVEEVLSVPRGRQERSPQAGQGSPQGRLGSPKARQGSLQGSQGSPQGSLESPQGCRRRSSSRAELRVRRSMRLSRDTASEGLAWVQLPQEPPPAAPATGRRRSSASILPGAENVHPREQILNPSAAPAQSRRHSSALVLPGAENVHPREQILNPSAAPATGRRRSSASILPGAENVHPREQILNPSAAPAQSRRHSSALVLPGAENVHPREQILNPLAAPAQGRRHSSASILPGAENVHPREQILNPLTTPTTGRRRSSALILSGAENVHPREQILNPSAAPAQSRRHSSALVLPGAENVHPREQILNPLPAPGKENEGSAPPGRRGRRRSLCEASARGGAPWAPAQRRRSTNSGWGKDRSHQKLPEGESLELRLKEVSALSDFLK